MQLAFREAYSVSCIGQPDFWLAKYGQSGMAAFPRSCHVDDMGRVVTLERRIRQLSTQAVAAKEPDALRLIMNELKNLLHEQNEELKLMVAEYPFLLDDLSKPAA
jgi:hypothetical protein